MATSSFSAKQMAVGVATAFLAVSFCLVLLGASRFPQKLPLGFLRNQRIDLLQGMISSSSSSSSSTTLQNLVFGIGAGAGAWEHRKKYVRLWWRPNETRGMVSLDRAVRDMQEAALPACKVADNRMLASKFRLRDQQMTDQVRITRLPAELFRLNFPQAHWFVLSDDDTFFVVDNLVKVLSKYDHRDFFYVGAFSESHYQSVKGFTTNMAFGGAGIALSYALVEALAGMQDDCLSRNERVWGVDGKLHACISELGVPLTVEKGFHQMDLHGDITGFLASHPITPLVSLHHLDSFEPIFPGMNRVEALEHLSSAIRVDSAGVLQTSFCYNKVFNWTFKVAWGYAVEVSRGLIPPRDLENPLKTFIEWFGCRSDTCLNFRTREVPADLCLRSIVFFMANVSEDNSGYSTYVKRLPRNSCRLQDDRLEGLESIRVRKEQSQYEAPRRQCCSIISPQQKDFQELEIRDCADGEFSHS